MRLLATVNEGSRNYQDSRYVPPFYSSKLIVEADSNIFANVPRIINFGQVRKGELVSQRIKLKNSRPFGFEFRVERSAPHEFITFPYDKGIIRGEQEIEVLFKPNAFITVSEK